jgi:hypothetical protein
MEEDALSADVKNNTLGSIGTVYDLTVTNEAVGAAIAYLKIWDATDPTLGTTEPDYIFQIPVGVTRMNIFSGLSVSNGLSFAATLLPEVADVTNPAQPLVIEALIG